MCGAELTSLPEGVQRVARALQDKGHPHSPVMLDDAARTAQPAADALGVQVGQIAKRLINRRTSDGAACRRAAAPRARAPRCLRRAWLCAAWTWTPVFAKAAAARSTRSPHGAG